MAYQLIQRDKVYISFVRMTTQHISYQQFAITFITVLSFEKSYLSFEKTCIKLNSDHFCIYME